jgi:hypothetical protein
MFHRSLKPPTSVIAPASIDRYAQNLICGHNGNEMWSILYRRIFRCTQTTSRIGCPCSQARLGRSRADVSTQPSPDPKKPLPRADELIMSQGQLRLVTQISCSSCYRDVGETGTTMLSVAAHLVEERLSVSSIGPAGGKAAKTPH